MEFPAPVVQAVLYGTGVVSLFSAAALGGALRTSAPNSTGEQELDDAEQLASINKEGTKGSTGTQQSTAS